MDKQKMIDDIENLIEAKRGHVYRLEQEVEETEKVIKMLRSDLFKLKTGKAFGDTFIMDKKEYQIINERYIKKVNGKNDLSAGLLEAYLTGKNDNPFRKPKPTREERMAFIRNSMEAKY